MTQHTLRELIIGPPLPTQRLDHERLDNFRALAALSPDALSSIAYANQEIFLGLAAAGAAGLVLSWQIALGIAVLLGIVAVSYTQVIHAYPNGGGSYTVARENLGEVFGLIAAAALLISYTLTAAVSLTAGVASIASAFPVLWQYRTVLALIMLVMITLANLRGIQESGTLMSIPVYLFVVAYLGMLIYGAVLAFQQGPTPYAETIPPAAAAGAQTLGLFLILHTFASGCTALTGVEAISNGVPMFRTPEPRNASRVMIIMAVLMTVLFLGSNALTQTFAVYAGPQETILSALSRRILGTGALYVIVQASTLLVLLVAGNTSFAGFPRLASILAQDGYLPRQLSFLGDRLVYSNGMFVLAALTGVLIVVFGGDSHLLIPLFAVGVFIAFTLSQTGMIAHWVKEKGRLWQLKALANTLGMLATGLTMIIVAVSKFLEGAWIVVILIPAFVAGFQAVHRHYETVRHQLTIDHGLPPHLKALPKPRLVIPVSGVHKGTINALRYARSISDNVIAVYVEIEPGRAERMRHDWDKWGLNEFAQLDVVPSPFRSIVGPFLDYLDHTDQVHNDGTLASVILPEFVPAHWWQVAMHNQTAWLLRIALLYRRRRSGKVRAIIDVPMFLRE